MDHVKLKTTGSSGNEFVHRPPLLPFIDCFETFGAAEVGLGPYSLVSAPSTSSIPIKSDLGLLLLTLLLLLLRLRLRNRRLSCSRTLSSSLLTHSFDGSDVSTDDTTLVLHGTTRALLGNLLGDTLLVHAAVDLCPCDLTGVLALEEEGGILGGGEAEDLGII
jgi:hypothetical protein